MSLKVYCDKRSNNARSMMQKMELTWVDTPEQADLIWMRKGYRPWYQRLKSHQLINHVPNEKVMTNKGHLTRHLNERPESKKFYKESYRLYEPQDMQNFMQALEQSDKQDIWILKPVDLSKGRGIHIVTDCQPLIDYFVKNAVSELVEKTIAKKKYIIQRYITDVLLLDGRKSEFRVYFLIKCLDPFEVYLYDEGVVRLCTTPFKLGDFDNKSIHVTNVYQQKQQKEYDPNLRLKWTFLQLQTYVEKNGYTDNMHYVNEVMMPAVADALRCTIESVKPLMQREQNKLKYAGHFFGLYGADFILDEQLNPWLTEVQVGPGLSHSDPIKQHVVVDMFQEVIRIMGGAAPQRFKVLRHCE
ncbi:MAG: tubulin--tyrosine ligase family protein [Gammaproteobacteria bacterium]|nr:tubulin--tyrosine ligase family protein [Gammaproteobacteria bacterium]